LSEGFCALGVWAAEISAEGYGLPGILGLYEALKQLSLSSKCKIAENNLRQLSAFHLFKTTDFRRRNLSV
jgi:hypothetical protein